MPNAFEDEYDGPPAGICDACGKSCTPVRRDMGFGAYEYWGARGVHHDWQMVSPCCEAEVVEGGETCVLREVRVARRDHAGGRIKAGQQYLLTVWRHWRAGGPSWITQEKSIITNGGTQCQS